MTLSQDDNADQAAFWNSEQGVKWVSNQAAMDILLQPVLDAVLDLAALRAGEQVLDIGCGSGTSAITAAQRVGPTGRVLGVDISQPLLNAARARAARENLTQLTFELADAAQADLGSQAFDVLMSRFGVMFFANPTGAFRQMASALKPGGRLAFATWGRIDANPWFVLPAQAAKQVLGPPEKSDPDAPGPFSMRDVEKLRGTLEDAGLHDIDITATQMTLQPPGGLQEVAALSCKIGPAARTLEYFSAGPDEERAVIKALEEKFAPLQTPDGVRIPAEINLVTARKP